MGSPSAVLTIGFGSWGSIGEVITLGYGSASVAATLTGVWSNPIAIHGNADRISVHGNQDRVAVHGAADRVGVQ